MSELQESLFSTVRRVEMPKKMQCIYKLFGIVGAIILMTAYFSSYQLLHLIGTSICIYGMIGLSAGYEIYKKGFQGYAVHLMRDVGLTVSWTVLAVIWLMDNM